MRPILLAAILLIPAFLFSQSFNKKAFVNKWDSVSRQGNVKLNLKTQDVSFFEQPRYKSVDTVRCLFLELRDSSEITWTHGFVVRESGFISFENHRSAINNSPHLGKTKVSPEYLPVTSGVVSSPLFYKDMSPVSNVAIQVILLPSK